MGWNSWDAYGTTITEAEVKKTADYMAAHLKAHGWQYIIVDIQWYEPNAAAHGYRPGAQLTMDENGRLTPAVNRFPSAANGNGFKSISDYIHNKGLKFGIHIMRGIPRQAVKANTPIAGSTTVHAADIADPKSTCEWNTDMYGVDMSKPGAQQYYDALAEMYAAWGVDYLKADDEGRPLHREEVNALHKAIVKSKRPIVLSISPGPALVENAEFLADNAQLWRVSDDFWDVWKDLRAAFDFLAKWTPYTRSGSWPDGDMLPLGRIGIRAERGDDRKTRFTPDEQRTLMTLWSIARSPLMFGGDLPSLDPETLALITNDEVLAANQKATNSRQVFSRDNQIVWMSDGPNGNDKYLAVFNVADDGAHDITVAWTELGLQTSSWRVRDLWQKKDLGAFPKEHNFSIPPHGSAIYRLTPDLH